MAEILSIKNIGLKGLNSDVPPWDLPPEYISNGINFRVRDTKLIPLGGSRLIVEAPSPAVKAGACLQVRIRGGESFWAQCTQDKILYTSVTNEGKWEDISRKDYSVPDETENHWTISQMGQLTVFNHPEVGVEYCFNPRIQGDVLPLNFSPGVTWEASGLRCKVMRAHKNFLIAMNLSGAEDSPNGYRISTAADIDGLPFTWDETDKSGIAIRAQLGGDGGEILDGRSLRDEFCIYSQDSIDLLRFNANSAFLWERRELSATRGLLNTKCLMEINSSHFLIVDGDIIRNDGSSVTSILNRRLLQRFNSKLSDATIQGSFVTRNDAFSEVWFCVPEDGATQPNIAYVYNWENDTFSIKDLPPQLVAASYGTSPILSELPETPPSPIPVEDPPPSLSLGTWNTNVGDWASGTGAWGGGVGGGAGGGSRVTALNAKILGLTVRGELKDLDPRDTIDEDGFETVAERTGFPLGGHKGTFTITRVYPHASGDAFILQIGAHQYANGPVVWSSERVFKPGSQRKIDLRVTGEALAWRVKSIKDNRFVFSGLDIDFVPSGER